MAGGRTIPGIFLICNLGEQESIIAITSVLDGFQETMGLETEGPSERTLLKDEHLSHLTTPDKMQARVQQVLERTKIDEKDVKAIIMAQIARRQG